MASPRRASIGLMLVVSAAGCGGAGSGAGTTPSSEGPCAAQTAAVTAASDALASCQAAPPPPWIHGARYDALIADLDAYEGALVFGDDGDATRAEALAAACWSFFDDLAAEVVDHTPLDAAEDAAETLLREREHDDAVEAAAAVRTALVRLHELFAAPSTVDCRQEDADQSDARLVAERCNRR